LFYSGIYDLISLLKKENLRVCLLTNGVLLNKENCKKLISLGVDSISISLDSLSPQINDLFRGRTNRVLDGINNLLAEAPKHTAITILQAFSRKNLEFIRPMIYFCKKNNLSLWLNPIQLNFNQPFFMDAKLENCSKEELDFLEKEMLYWAQNIRKISYQKYLRAKKYIKFCLSLIRGKKPKEISCPMGNDFFVLDVEGNLYPCFLRKDIFLGNVYKEKLSTVLDTPQFKTTLSKLKTAYCVQLGCVCFAS
jgi:MoaA/NifB/PqqE/SkfB family radical SAM enzyme